MVILTYRSEGSLLPLTPPPPPPLKNIMTIVYGDLVNCISKVVLVTVMEHMSE